MKKFNMMTLLAGLGPMEILYPEEILPGTPTPRTRPSPHQTPPPSSPPQPPPPPPPSPSSLPLTDSSAPPWHPSLETLEP